MLRRSRLPLLVLAAALPLAVACGSKDDDEETPTTSATSSATAAVTGSASPAGSPTVSPTPEIFEGTTGPTEVEKPTPPQVVTLVDVRVGMQAAGYDRIVFEFDGDIPSYRIEYVVPPIAGCGSGLDTDIEGDAMLKVTIRPLQAHDEAGDITVPATELAPAYPAMVEAEQTCDFEGVVEWGVGATDELPYRVTELTGPPRLVVDVQHPE